MYALEIAVANLTPYGASKHGIDAEALRTWFVSDGTLPFLN